MKQVSIGIIGGMGPQASVKLHQLIVEGCSRQLNIKLCHEFPQITHISLPVKDFISDPDLRFESIPMLKSAAKLVSAVRPDIVVIACNTAHLLVGEVEALKKMPLISLPESVILVAKKLNIKKLGLLATPTTIKTKLYENHTDGGLYIVTCDPEDQKKLEKIIRRTIAGQNNDQDSTQLLELANGLIQKGAEMVALGCTELSVAIGSSEHEKIIDSLSAASSVTLSKIEELSAV